MAWRRGKAFSKDLCDRVLPAAKEKALPVGSIAERLPVAIYHVSKPLSRYRLTGGLAGLATGDAPSCRQPQEPDLESACPVAFDT
jgi:hypothetical protein